jgi:hypothetical protein
MNNLDLKNNKYSSLYVNSWEQEAIAKAKSMGVDKKRVGEVLEWLENYLIDIGKNISQSKKQELVAKITGPRP